MGPVVRVEVMAVGPSMPPVQYTGTAPPGLDTMTLVVLTDEDGTVGMASYDADSYDHHDLASMEGLRAPARAVLGRDPLDRLRIGAEIAALRPTPFTAPGPVSAIETALWDLAAKSANQPLFQYLGGARDAIPGYASLPVSDTVEACLEMVGEAQAAGFGCVKLHVSGDPRTDAVLAERVRAAFSDLEVMWDAEGVYDGQGAAYVAAALDAIGARWFEAPLPDQDLAGYRDLRRRFGVPLIPAGDFFWDLRVLGEVLRDPPWDAIRSEASAGGGIGYLIRLAGLAESFGLQTELATYGFGFTQAANLHAMLGLGSGSYFEQPFPAEPWTFGLTDPHPFGYGAEYHAPDAPGLGVPIDLALIEPAVVARFVVQ